MAIGKCPRCRGTGVIRKSAIPYSNKNATETVACPTCSGTGKIEVK